MNGSKKPYENNSYLKNEEEVLKEVLFFKKFGIEQEKESEISSEQDEEVDCKEK